MLQVFYELTPDVMVEMQTVRYKAFEVGTTCSTGEAFVGKIPFDDPGSTLTIKGWRKARVYETTATPTLLWAGRIRNKTVKRGDAERPSLRTGSDRWWDCDAIDQNTLLGARVIRGTAANRPAESAGERLRWLLSTSFTVLVDGGHVTYPTDRLDPNDYTLQTDADVIADCAQPGGYNFFAMLADPAVGTELFFMLPSDSAWASTISISDNLADVDNNTVFAPNYEAEVLISDEIIAEGVAVPYNGTGTNSYVYVSDTAIGTEFAHVDRTAPMANVKTSAAATVVANRHLALSSTEDERITCTIHVPATHANKLRPWHLVPYKSTWMPGFEGYRDCRAVNWSIEQEPFPDGGDGYLIHLELTPVAEIEPLDTAGPLHACNTVVETSDRNAVDESASQSFSAGEVWRYTLTQPSHDGQAVTDSLRLDVTTAGPVIEIWGANFGLPSWPAGAPAQGAAPTSAISLTGTFVISSSATGTFRITCKAGYYGGPAVTHDECWDVLFERLS